VSQTVDYINQSQIPLPDLVFVVEPNRQPGVFHLDDLRWADSQPIKGYKLDGALLHIPLHAPLSPGAELRLFLTFELNLPAQAGPLGYTSRQSNLGDWYPFVPPYRVGQGWLVHEPAQVGEHLVYDVADYQVDISLADPATAPIIAASAPAVIHGNQYHYELGAVRSFAWSASSEYRVISKLVNSVAVVGYVFPEHFAAGQAATDATASALSLYSSLFISYPHTSLAMVEADFADGMEYEGLYFIGQEYLVAYSGNPQGYLTAVAVHETAHQWWYGLVGNIEQVIESLERAH
jgi:hypothetical protein